MLCMGACGMLLGFARMGMKMHGVQDCGYLIPLTIPMVMIGVWAIIPDKVWRKSIVGMTFGIYVVHINMIAIFNITQKHFFAQSNAYVVLMVVKYAFALAASMGCVWLLRRMMPRFAALAFGGR